MPEGALALQAALAIVDGMKSLGGQGCIGVTTGQLLCACVGSRIRAEYTVFGDSINLSARLMCKATAGMGDILCDYSTQHMATNAAAYTRLEPLVVSLLTAHSIVPMFAFSLDTSKILITIVGENLINKGGEQYLSQNKPGFFWTGGIGSPCCVRYGAWVSDVEAPSHTVHLLT